MENYREKISNLLFNVGCEPEFVRDNTDKIERIIKESATEIAVPMTDKLCASKIKEMTQEITEGVRKEFEKEKGFEIRNIMSFISESVNSNGTELSKKDFITSKALNDPEYNEKQLILNTYFDNWQLLSRTGAPEFISDVHVVGCLIVNASGPGMCYALLPFIKGRDRPLLFMNGDLSDRNIISELRNEKISTKTKYVAEAFRRSLYFCKYTFFLTIPTYPGWNLTPDGKKAFVCSSLTSSKLLRLFYDNKSGLYDVFDDIVLPPEVRPIDEIIEVYRTEISDNISVKEATVISSMSRILPFFKEEGLSQDKVWVEEASGQNISSSVTAFVPNRDFRTVDKIFSSDHINKLNSQLKKHIDCVFLVRHRSYLESKYELEKVLKLTANVVFSYDESSRTVPMLAIDNVGLIPEDFPMQKFSLNHKYTIADTENVRKVICEVNAFLIHFAENNPDAFKILLKSALFSANELVSDLHVNNTSNSILMFISTAFILKEFNILSFVDIQQMVKCLLHESDRRTSAESAICHSVGKALSDAIINGKLIVANQFSPPFWNPDKAFVASDGSLNMSRMLFDDILSNNNLPYGRNKILHSLEEEDLSFPNSPREHQRTLTLYSTDGRRITKRFISLSCDILNSEARRKVDEVLASDLFYKTDEAISDFYPYIKHHSLDMVAGQVITDYRKMNPFMCVTGGPGSRKSTFLMMQALQRAMNDDTVIVLDTSNSFSLQELYEHGIPKKIVDKYFIFWDVCSEGWPVDLMDFSKSASKEEMISVIYSLLVSGTHLSGESQLSILTNKISAMLDDVSKQEGSEKKDISCICDYFDQTDADEKKVYNRLKALFCHVNTVDTIPQKWQDFLNYRGKIIVFSNGGNVSNADVNVMDVIFDSLYSYKDKHRENSLTVIIDEIQKMNLRSNAPLNTLLSLGRKSNISMIIASQIFSKGYDNLGRIEGYCGTKIFCRPMDNCIDTVSKITGISEEELQMFEDGYCAVMGSIYSEYYNKNIPMKTAVCGYIYRLPELGEYKDYTEEFEQP